MKRRRLLLAGGALLAAAAAPAFSQAPKLRRIAFLHPARRSGTQAEVFESFRAGLKELGYIEGRDISIEATWADDQTERLPSLAAAIVARKPEVLVTATTAGVAACSKATSTIPIVFASLANPVEQGFVSTLQRPGGNITGVLIYPKLTQKLVEVAREALPGAKRLALLTHEADPAHKYDLEDFEETARRQKFTPLVVKIARREDLGNAFAELAKRKTDAVIVGQLAIFGSNQSEIGALALKTKLAVLSAQLSFAEHGALLSYGTSREENYRRAAALVDKILRGAKPADLAVEQPQRFYLIVNRRTAKLIGAKLGPAMNGRADRIID
jgi:putative ABC transport system substrate-binding protein